MATPRSAVDSIIIIRKRTDNNRDVMNFTCVTTPDAKSKNYDQFKRRVKVLSQLELNKLIVAPNATLATLLRDALYGGDAVCTMNEFRTKSGHEVRARYECLVAKYERLSELMDVVYLNATGTILNKNQVEEAQSIYEHLFLVPFGFYLDLFHMTTSLTREDVTTMNGNSFARHDFSSFLNIIDFMFHENMLTRIMRNDGNENIGKTIDALWRSSKPATFKSYVLKNIKEKIKDVQNSNTVLCEKLASLKKQQEEDSGGGGGGGGGILGNVSAICCDAFTWDALNQIKTKYGDFRRSNKKKCKLNVSRICANDFQKEQYPSYASRAWTKLHDIVTMYPWILPTTTTTHGKIIVLDLAANPGSFTQYLRAHVPTPDDTHFIAISLHGLEKLDSLSSVSTILQDVCDTNTVVTKIKSVISEIQGGPLAPAVLLVVADGARDKTNHNGNYDAETFNFELIKSEIDTATQVLAEGGTLVVKLFDTVRLPTLKLIYQTALSFKRTHLVKPKHSLNVNAEKYFVFGEFIKSTENIQSRLLIHPDQAFLMDMYAANQYLLRMQHIYLGLTLELKI
ncbi:hypothetical protein WDU94_012436 [Cyamophila willieti]